MTAQFLSLPTNFSLAAVFAWGTSDFLGGYGARRANAFALTAIAHLSGLLLMAAIALASHAPFPSRSAVAWALLGGLSGGGALAIFYRALATGRMGLTAPVAAVLGAAIPTAFGMFREGLPQATQVAGFVMAATGIWLISRTEDESSPEGIGMAALAGIGFAGFYLCIRQAGDGSAFWIAATSKVASFVLTGLIVLIGRSARDIDRRGIALGILAGCLDVIGSVLFIRASQTGRLDAAVVLSSLYPAVTVLLARFILKEHFTRWKALGMVAALLAVPMIACR
ncbi:MAG: DMT family transporter [Terriglobales bacterium]|jgi:drug/metabolite transporter (DMT)-like permease